MISASTKGTNGTGRLVPAVIENRPRDVNYRGTLITGIHANVTAIKTSPASVKHRGSATTGIPAYVNARDRPSITANQREGKWTIGLALVM